MLCVRNMNQKVDVPPPSRDGRARADSVCVVTCDCSKLQVSHAAMSRLAVSEAQMKRREIQYAPVESFEYERFAGLIV